MVTVKPHLQDQTTDAARQMLTFGKYRAIAELGVGGMAEVYLAVAHGVAGFSKLHVIKRLKKELAVEEKFLTMFLDEARLAARLNHPNIVQTYEVSVEESGHFLVLEYVDGVPLSALLRRAHELGESVPLMLHLQIIHDMLSGLHYAHEATDFDGTPLQIIHRDVSPHNVLVSVDGNVKLADFGVAKAAIGSANTMSGTIKGKVRYLSPEQVSGDPMDRRSDMFAVGVMLWEALAQERFWGEEPEIRVIARLMTGELPPVLGMSEERGSQDLAKIVSKALAIHPDNRYATAAELRDDLADFLHAQGRRPTEQTLGAFVSRLFESRRALIRSAIERRQAEFAAENFTGPLLDLQVSQTGSSMRRKDSDPTLLDSPSSTGSTELAATKDAREASGSFSSSRRSGKITWLAVVVGALVVIGLVLYGVFRRDSMATAPVVLADGAPPATTVEMIALHVEAVPSDAVLFLDEAELPANPFHGEYAKDDKKHVVRVQAEGFDEQRMTVSFLNDVTVRVTLVATVALPSSASAEPAQPGSRPPSVGTSRTEAPSGTKRKPANTFDPGDPWK